MSGDHFSHYSAVYQDTPISDYAGNPLIEALPPLLSPEEGIALLERRPQLPVEHELKQAAHIRLHYVGRLRDLVLSLPEYVNFEPYVALMIRQGYIARNPLADSTWARIWRANLNRSEEWRLPPHSKPAETILFCGLSGTGKTTFITRLLSQYPQIIDHTQYKTKSMVLRQVSWLKIDCPKDGTPIGLCKNFFASMDRLLGTRYSDQAYSRMTGPDYMNLMGRIATNHFLGVLVVDELQNLSVRKSGGEKGLLDQLAAMFEVLEIPIIYIGTPSVTRLFQKKLQNVRRSSSLGCHFFERPESSQDVHWVRFMEQIWEYQWTSTKTKLTPRLVQLFFDHCQGITFFAIAMFTQCQFRLIADDEATAKIDKALLDDIAQRELLPLQPALKALRSNDQERLEAFEDLICEIRQFGSLLEIPTHRSKGSARSADAKLTLRTPKIVTGISRKSKAPDPDYLNALADSIPNDASEFKT